MNILLCLPNAADFETVLAHIKVPDVEFIKGKIYSTQFLSHQVDICFTGETLFETAHSITKAITQKKYNLALKAGFCTSWKADLPIGEVVNVIKEKPISFNADGNDLYEMKALNDADFPHFKGSFINMNNSYMNVFLELRKVVSATVNRSERMQDVSSLREQYKADTETQNGIGFVYSCMFERQPFYQINVVERNIITHEFDHELAKKSLNETLISILAVI